MKQNLLKVLAAAAVLSMLAGCIVLSVYPFYNAKDLVFDSGLTGQWAKLDTTNQFWKFAQAGEKSYTLVVSDENETNCFSAHLFHLKQYEFLDLLTTNRGQFELPMHLISQVSLDDTNLSLRFLDYGWLASLIETNPIVLRHLIVPENPDDTNGGKMIYLTAGTADLQKFLLKYAADTNAFGSGSAMDFNRVSQ